MEDLTSVQRLARELAAQRTMTAATELLTRRLAKLLSAPLAVLSRADLCWRFEAHAFPEQLRSSVSLAHVMGSTPLRDAVHDLQEDSGHAWTAVALGVHAHRDWALLLPGASAAWAERPGFHETIEGVAWSLSQVASTERADSQRRFLRTLYVFGRRLARPMGAQALHALVVRTLAVQVRATTGAIATYAESEGMLRIDATFGYPVELVEHLRIHPGEAVIGHVFSTGKPLLGDASSMHPSTQRLRYRTDSYMALPITSGGTTLAVVTVTDRVDGRPFDQADFGAARALATAAAPAFARERTQERLDELTRVARVDPVTALFNRRYFENRLEAEIERARREEQDLALLLVDIDDFKRVNDTRGHVEGDRTLRDVADLLRANVRIFDICARYGGEEFVIVMPGASEAVAKQVGRRIRMEVERSFRHASPPMTVSIGIGMLGPSSATVSELVDRADRGLIAAKRAGKNMVWTPAAAYDEPPAASPSQLPG